MEQIILSPEMKRVVNPYYENDAKKLHKTVHEIFKKHNWKAKNDDMEEFYSVANDVMTDIIKHERYDSSKSKFSTFFEGALTLGIIDEFKKQNRDKRVMKVQIEIDGKIQEVSIPEVYLDAPIDEDGSSTAKDLLPSNFNIEAELEGECYFSENMQNYLDSLSANQRKMLLMLSDGYQASEVKEKLNLTNAEYANNWNTIKSFSKINILFKENTAKFMEDDKDMNAVTQTMENCKTDKISVASVNKKIDRNILRFNHPLQRESDQWTSAMKGNQISDMLQGNKLHPLIFAEQIINGVPIIWGLDGKQRCTNAYSFVNDGYKISKNIRRWNIKYQTTEKDENGNEVFDDNGFPIAKIDEFDIRGKKFSDLPEELKERFLDYTFNYDQYLNCSEEDIGYHIERYNDGKPMNTAQKGIIKLGTAYVEMVKSISNMPFFKDMGGYKSSEFRNGTINRVVVESVMAANYIDEWKREQDSICKYLKENADITVFENFEDMVGRLEKVVTDDVADMFDSKDSFLWFGLFARFINTDYEDKKFIEFMAEFAQSLHNKAVKGMTFDKLCIDPKTGKTRSTKDKYIVVPKMQILETLMYEYLDTAKEVDNIVDEYTLLDFVKENVNPEVTNEDISDYEEDYEIITLDVKNKSRLLDKRNKPSLIAMVAYGYKNDIIIDDWMIHYMNSNTMYLNNQKKNFLHMVDDLENYLVEKAVA